MTSRKVRGELMEGWQRSSGVALGDPRFGKGHFYSMRSIRVWARKRDLSRGMGGQGRLAPLLRGMGQSVT
jgi:hypothetical protein